jgi:hypothetical protein
VKGHGGHSSVRVGKTVKTKAGASVLRSNRRGIGARRLFFEASSRSIILFERDLGANAFGVCQPRETRHPSFRIMLSISLNDVIDTLVFLRRSSSQLSIELVKKQRKFSQSRMACRICPLSFEKMPVAFWPFPPVIAARARNRASAPLFETFWSRDGFDGFI